MLSQEEQTEIKARISELKTKYARLAALCSFGARISRETIENYAQEIEKLEAQLN